MRCCAPEALAQLQHHGQPSKAPLHAVGSPTKQTPPRSCVLQVGKSVEDLPTDLLDQDVVDVIANANSPAMAVAVLLRQLTR